MATKNEPGIGHNGGPPLEDDFISRMPKDAGEALKFSWLHYGRLMSYRKELADHRSQAAKDIAGDHGVKPVLVKLGFRMARMTPEKRQTHADTQNAVLALFGYSPLGVADTETIEADTLKRQQKFRAALETDKYVFEQQRETNARMKALQAKAREVGVDWSAMAAVYRLNRAATGANANSDDDVSDTPASDLFDRMDAVGRFVGVWQS